jgi:CRP-like cAMP-binding protein
LAIADIGCITPNAANVDVAHRNAFLASLPERERARLFDLGSVVDHIAVGTIIHETGGLIRDIWFPLDSVASLTATTQDGAEAEVAIIGREGLIGVTALVGGSEATWNEAVVQIGGAMLRVPLERMREEAVRSPFLRLLLQRYAQALLVQASQTAVCNRFHTIEQRLARCLLALHDRVGSEDIAITQERLAGVLGSLRPGVTLAAQHLQDAQIIRYTRGRIHIIDRKRLVERACECYEAVADEYERLLGPTSVAGLDAAGVPDEVLREVNSRLLIAAVREQQAREAAERAIEARHASDRPAARYLAWLRATRSKRR